MRVKLAAQILSHSVAAGIHTLCELKVWSGEKLKIALKTAEFVENFNNLFDIFNSKTFNESKPYSKPITNDSKTWEFLSKCMTWLPNLKVKNNPNKQQLPCVQAWQININSIIYLYNRLSNDPNINLKYIFTNRLNQDALENFFSLIRAKNRNDDRPDSSRFESAFRSLSVESIFNLSKNSNCEDDWDNFLIKPEDLYNEAIQSVDTIATDHPYSQPSQPINITTDEFPDLIDTNATAYIAGYLIKKFPLILSCQNCKQLLTTSLQEQPHNNKYIFLKHKQYSTLSSDSGLVIPSESFISLLESFQQILTFQLNIFSPNNITRKITDLCFEKLSCHQNLTCGQNFCKN